ncbi:MAG: hypothetical protein KBT34_12450 [Prevotella sp.]|nr:hypothetical protein [Candidatus Prevotella equi]
MKYLIIIAVWLISSIEPLSAITPSAVCEIDSSMIEPLYFDGPHSFRIADTQTVPDMENGQFTVSWYVDTEEWDFDPQTNHIFSKIVFKKGNSILATFGDNEGWSYFGVENSKAKMFKSFKINSDYTAIVFRGGVYAAGVPKLTIFVLCGNEVKLVFNKEYFIENVNNNKITIKRDSQDTEYDYLTITNGHVSIITKEHPTGKIIF